MLSLLAKYIQMFELIAEGQSERLQPIFPSSGDFFFFHSPFLFQAASASFSIWLQGKMSLAQLTETKHDSTSGRTRTTKGVSDWPATNSNACLLCVRVLRDSVVFSALFLAGCSVFENCKRCNNGTWGPRDDFFVSGSYCAECRPGWSGGDCMSKPLHWKSSEAPLKTGLFFRFLRLAIPAFNTNCSPCAHATAGHETCPLGYHLPMVWLSPYSCGKRTYTGLAWSWACRVAGARA